MAYKDPNQQREYVRRWIAKRRADFFADKSCVQCGSVDALELDHIDPDLKISHVIWSWSQSRRDKELAKCQVLCHNCHLMKTSEWRRRVVKHGSKTMYSRYKCRCNECKSWKSVENARRYLNHD